MLYKQKDNNTTYESTCSSIKNSPVIKNNSYTFGGEKIRNKKGRKISEYKFFSLKFLKIVNDCLFQ